MGEFASKGVAGTGLGLSIAGLSAALLSNSNGNGGLLGGLLGGNNCNQAIAERDSVIARLTSEKYTDNAVLALRDK